MSVRQGGRLPKGLKQYCVPPLLKSGLSLWAAGLNLRPVRWLTLTLVLSAWCWLGLPARAASAKIIKVLPHYLNLEGRHTTSPSLYDRDAYQAYLRQHPAQCSGLRFDVQWKAKEKKPLKLRLELRGARGNQPTTAVLEETVTKDGWFSNWTALPLTGEAYKNFGGLTAWRATLWDGTDQVAEQKSFLW